MLWLDGITAAFAAAALGAAILVDLVLETTEGSTSTVVTNLAYPLGDVLLLSAVFGVFSLTGWRPGRRWLVLGLGSSQRPRRTLSTSSSPRTGRTSKARGWTSSGRWRCCSSPRPRGCPTGPARGSRSKAGHSSPSRVCAVVATGILVYDHFTG